MSQRDLQHTCHATGCETHIPPRMFMCKPHWFALPKRLRDAIWAEYVPGQERRMDPIDAYLQAALEAIEYLAPATTEQLIAEAEGR